MEKWYNLSQYAAEKKAAYKLVYNAVYKDPTYKGAQFNDDLLEKVFQYYLDVSLRLKSSYDALNTAEWKVMLSDLWVTSMFIAYKGIPSDTPVEKIRGTLEPGNDPWIRDQIIIFLNSIRDALKGNGVYNKYYAPYKFEGTVADIPAPKKSGDGVDISTATQQIKKSGIAINPLYIGIAAVAALGLYMVMKKK